MLQGVLQKKAEARAPARDRARADRRVSRERPAGLHGGRLPPGDALLPHAAGEVAPLRMRLRELASARPRLSYRRLDILLRREGGG
jgi:hypothetical protein